MAKAAPAPLSASLLAVPKGAATPAADAPPDVGGEEAAAVATPPKPVRPQAPKVAPPPIEEPRTALTVRLPVSTQERLREAAHRSRLEKQSIVDEALIVWLDENGY